MLYKCFVFTGKLGLRRVYYILSSRTASSYVLVSFSQQARDIDSMLVYCWTDAVDGGPTVNQHCQRLVFAGLLVLWSSERVYNKRSKVTVHIHRETRCKY